MEVKIMVVHGGGAAKPSWEVEVKESFLET